MENRAHSQEIHCAHSVNTCLFRLVQYTTLILDNSIFPIHRCDRLRRRLRRRHRHWCSQINSIKIRNEHTRVVHIYIHRHNAALPTQWRSPVDCLYVARHKYSPTFFHFFSILLLRTRVHRVEYFTTTTIAIILLTIKICALHCVFYARTRVCLTVAGKKRVPSRRHSHQRQ